MEEGKKEKRVLLSGILLLSLSTVLVKIVGLLYKIPLLSYLGSEGMGYFNSAYEIYALFCVISTAGMPVALSILISSAIAKGREDDVPKIYRTGLWIFLFIGIIGSVGMVLFAPAFCRLMKSENAYECIVSIAPAVLLICLTSAIRGFFQGYQRMLPTAISQVFEAIGKLFFGLLFAQIALSRGLDTPSVAAAAAFGITAGSLLSCIYLIIEKVRFVMPKYKRDPGKTAGQIGKTLAKLAIPMTIGASAVSLTRLIDMTLILRRLQSIGFDAISANEAYGSYTTLAVSVFSLIPTLLNSIALPLIPLLCAAISSGDQKKQQELVQSSIRLVALFAIPSALGITAFAKPILTLLFGNDPKAVSIAAPLLSALGASVFLSCMITATNSVLHAYRCVKRPILSFLAGAVVKIIFAYFLIGNAKIGLLGAAISTFACDLAVTSLNLFFMRRFCKLSKCFANFLLPTLTSGMAVGITMVLYRFIVSKVGEGQLLTMGTLMLTALLYL